MNLKSILGLVIIFVFTACTPQEKLQKFAGLTQGTSYHVTVWVPGGGNIEQLKSLVDQELARIDKLLSNYRDDSVLELFNRQQHTDPVKVGEEIVQLLRKAEKVSIATQGCYDLTSKPLFALWGFNGDNPAMPDPAELQRLKQRIGYDKIEIIDNQHIRKREPGIEIDISSIAQGYSVARIGRLLEQQGIENYLVEIGGELETKGSKPGGQPWRVAIERPLPGARKLQKIITIRQKQILAVMTSGTYRHYFDEQGRRYSHILDARTAKPVTHQTVSVTVLHDDATQADAWSTALLCLGREQGIKTAEQAGIAALFLEQVNDDLVEYSSQPWQQLKNVDIQ